VNKKDIGPANVQIRLFKEKDGDAIAVSYSMHFGSPRPEYYREQLASATKGAGINTSLVAEARTTTLQAECKR
jgi:hypothetical protein